MALISCAVYLLLASHVFASALYKPLSKRDRVESLITEASNKTSSLNKRYNTSPDYSFVSWSALGDSFSAGPGAGEPTSDPGGNCYRNQGSYPYVINQAEPFTHYWQSPAFHFSSCTGAKIPQVRDTQEGLLGKSITGLITLSISGNDIGFTTVLKACVFFPFQNCPGALTQARGLLYGATLFNNYIGLITDIQALIAPVYSTTIYQTAYPSFFESYTTQCNNVRFNRFLGGPLMTQDLRQSLNQLGQELNYMLSFWIDRISAEYTRNYPGNFNPTFDFIKFVDQDEAYSGGRMCREEVTEPDRNNPGNYWYNFYSNRNNDPGNADSSEAPGSPGLVDASAYSSIDINTCEQAAEASDRMDDMLACLIAQQIAEGTPLLNDDGSTTAASSGPIYPQLYEPLAKSFHPTPLGFQQTAKEVQSRLFYRPIYLWEYYPGFERKPSNKKLKIMCIGDSITQGFQSSQGYGYRERMWSLLAREYSEGGVTRPLNQVVFVGSQTSGSDPDYNHNEGYDGYTVSQIRNAVIDSGTLDLQPNVIILMAGTNDVNPSSDPNVGLTLIDALDSFISELYAAIDGVLILVNHIPSIGTSVDYGTTVTDVQRRVTVYNAAISAMVARRRSQGDKILKVHTTPSYYDKADELHPNDDGYVKIADDILERLANAEDIGWLTDKADWSGVGVDECFGLPNWIQQGEIANGAGLGQNYYQGYACSPYPQDENCDNCHCYCVLQGDTSGNSFLIDRNGRDCTTIHNYTTAAVHFADLNGDGRAEYLWVGEAGDVTAFQNDGYTYQDAQHGSVTWWPRGKIAGGVGSRRDQIHFADINGDGRADYLYVHDNGSVSLWINGLTSSTDIADMVWIEQGLVAGGIGEDGDGVRFADLNGDGRAEYLWVDANGAVTAYLNGGYTYVDGQHGTVGWIAQGVIATGVGEKRENTYFADTNGDGKADYLAVSHTDGSVKLWINQGGPDDGPNAAKVAWWERGTIATGVGTSGTGVQFGDLNGDGRVEYLDVNPDTSAVNAWLNGC